MQQNREKQQMILKEKNVSTFLFDKRRTDEWIISAL